MWKYFNKFTYRYAGFYNLAYLLNKTKKYIAPENELMNNELMSL